MAAKSKTYRIQKVAVELNVSFGKLIEHLNENNFDVEDKITAKISQEMYDLLQAHFSADKEAKEESLSLRRTEKVEKQIFTRNPKRKISPKNKLKRKLFLSKTPDFLLHLLNPQTKQRKNRILQKKLHQ